MSLWNFYILFFYFVAFRFPLSFTPILCSQKTFHNTVTSSLFNQLQPGSWALLAQWVLPHDAHLFWALLLQVLHMPPNPVPTCIILETEIFSSISSQQIFGQSILCFFYTTDQLRSQWQDTQGGEEELRPFETLLFCSTGWKCLLQQTTGVNGTDQRITDFFFLL